MFEAIAFYTFSALTIVLFYITVTTNNALYALSSLAAGMIVISGFFFLLGAEFLGVIQLIVYSGAVMAMYAFGMMFFDSTRIIKEKAHSAKTVFSLSGLSALLIVAILTAPIISDNVTSLFPPIEGVGNTENLGYVLFTKYLIPFELAAVMLLVAMIAGIVLASKKMDIPLEKDTE
jgi:NADH-quinone oxidoreductase subunit J